MFILVAFTVAEVGYYTRKFFEPTIQVGVIAHQPTSYDANVWWQSSEGVKSIISEAIGYIYVKVWNP